MNIGRLLRRKRRLSHILIGVLGLIAGALIGIYVNVVTPAVEQVLGHWGSTIALLIGAVICFIAQLYVIFNSSGEDPSHELAVDELRSLLEAATRALIHPHSIERYSIRVQCRVANTKSKTLDPFCQWSYPICPDETLAVKYDGDDRDVIIISKAFRNKRVVAEDITDEHTKRYSDEHRGGIWDDVKSVLAAPIMDPKNPRSNAIGTISFDSSMKLSSVKLDSNEAKIIAQLLANRAYSLLRDLYG
jgi:hypothetical protein